jgi:hypothetical protein
MEGVSNKFCDMVYNTWLIQTSIAMTNNILDQGNKPAVISAIMKEQTTERGRMVINDAMDIHGGSSICSGPNNFTQKFYNGIPIGITVEGSNTLTKNLIIFGQGLNKSHPYIYDIYDSIVSDDLNKFKYNFNNIVKHSLKLYFKSLFTFEKDNLTKQTLHFANLSNFIALLGGEIKKNQSISSDMADILSNIYLGSSLVWYQEYYNVSEVLTNYCLNRLLSENSILFNRVIDNYPNNTLRFLLKNMKRPIESINYNHNHLLIDEIETNKNIMNHIKKHIYIDKSLKKLEQLDMFDINSKDYKEIYENIISVEEYKNKIEM